MSSRRFGRALSSDDGAATIVACIIAMALIAVAGIAIHIAAAGLARHRAQTAADAGALAAAAVVLHGPEAACRRAQIVADANRGVVDSCDIDGFDVLIMTHVSVRIGPLSARAVGMARAGPEEHG